MAVIYQRSYTPSPEERRRQEQRKARERNQKRVRWIFTIANIAAIVILIIPLFAIAGFFAAVGIGLVLVVVMGASYIVVNKAVSKHPTLGLLTSVGIIGIVVFVGTATIHASFPKTLPEIDVSAIGIESNISKVNSIQQSQYARSSTAVYPYRVGNRLFLYTIDNFGTSHIEIPQNYFMNFGERLWQNLGGNVNVDIAARLSKQTGNLADIVSAEGLVSVGSSVLVIDGDVPTVNFQQAFPNKVVLRTVSMDEKVIITHLEGLYTASPLNSDNTAIINGIPRNASELEKIGLLESEWNQWNGIYDGWNNAIGKSGFSVSGNSAQDTLKAFQMNSNVIVIVAHSDGYKIFFPDGSSLSTDDLSSIQDSIQMNKPLVTLFSCETAKIDQSLVSFAKRLVDLGARAVVAPVSTIGARSSSVLLDGFLRANVEGLSPVDALQKAIQETNNLSMETWIGMILDFKKGGNTL